MVAIVRVQGLEAALESLDLDIQSEVNQLVRSRTLQAFGDVSLATPVDTGRARNSWRVSDTIYQISDFDLIGQEVVNTTSYIEDLNMGSSNQAPSLFIEQSFLRYFDEVNLEIIPGEL